jgi:hypothetical protein
MKTLHFPLVQCGECCVLVQLVAIRLDCVVQVRLGTAHWQPIFYGTSCVKLRKIQANFKTCRGTQTDKTPRDKKKMTTALTLKYVTLAPTVAVNRAQGEAPADMSCMK